VGRFFVSMELGTRSARSVHGWSVPYMVHKRNSRLCWQPSPSQLFRP
jgi:hypothetical protein